MFNTLSRMQEAIIRAGEALYGGASAKEAMKIIEQQRSTELGLKKQIIKRRNERDLAQEKCSKYSNQICTLALEKKIDENDVWKIVEEMNVWTQCSSRDVGVLTTIQNYTTKAGKTYPAHFTENGHFVEKCSVPNEKPKGYHGRFKITRERFRFVLNPEAKFVSELFVGIYA